MNDGTNFSIVVPENFIQATRDSGYKSLGSALAELVDNAFEAKATQVLINLEKIKYQESTDVRITVADNGQGMDSLTLRHALRFGWSSRFNQRNSYGRYGMGLPNASLSHARRVEVWSSTDGRTASKVYLDIDEVVSQGATNILHFLRINALDFLNISPFTRGTLVAWSRCDRIVGRKLEPLTRKLCVELGRLFRYQLLSGKKISVNGEKIRPFDPLFEKEGINLCGAKSFGPELLYEVETSVLPQKISTIKVRFTELPIQQWHSLPNSEKNIRGIAKNAGVCIVRAGREIDHGWFFMGQKRKENYDDWWRCEICFDPDLDELFGVTHTKQEIHPTEKLLSILSPDMEKIARELNGRARRTFLEIKKHNLRRESERLAERHDGLLEPPSSAIAASKSEPPKVLLNRRGRVGGLEYRVEFQRINSPCFYQPQLEGSLLTVVLNEAHPLIRSIIEKNPESQDRIKNDLKEIELLIIAAARTELALADKKQVKTWAKNFRQSWSRTLAAFLN